jgi:DMSO/TMAO reductase YedYZ molybdopterin-dependent catalytic subunit
MHKKNLSIAYIVIILILSVFVIGGCSQSNNSGSRNTGPVEEWSIDVEVTGKEAVKFTNLTADETGPIEVEIAVKDKDTFLEEETWTGVLLKDVLEYVGVKEFSVVSVESADGYSREYEPDIVNSEGTAIGWIRNGEPLGEEDGFVKLVVDGKGPKWQIDHVSKIVVIP